MPRTLNQRMADAHEADLSEVISGKVQKGSGNQWHAQGDVKNGEYLVSYPVTADCKATLGKGISVTREMWSKIVEQTFGQNPALFLRWYADESLRKVDTDLAVVSVSLFSALLRDARKWQAVENAMEPEGAAAVDLDAVLVLLRAGSEAEIPSEPGCDCCR